MEDTTSKKTNILFPAYQKFYSALINLDKFNKKNDFFENISALDVFFSEFRNITFVLQKSMSHDADLKDIYERLKIKYLFNDTCKWMLNKRNETTKEHPFDLEKQLLITVYTPESTMSLKSEMFTIENDTTFSSLKEQLKIFFTKLSLVEIHFSVEYRFCEKGSDKNIIDQMMEGVRNMLLFLDAFQQEITEDCILCSQVKEKIERLHVLVVPQEMLFNVDYLYHYIEQSFERGSYTAILHSHIENRATLARFDNIFGETMKDKDVFYKFIIMHLSCFKEQRSLMPIFMIVYRDDTFTLESCAFSIRTTLYRKIHEITNRIEIEDIREIYYVAEAYSYEQDIYKQNILLPYNERVKKASKEVLIFYVVNSMLEWRSLSFDSDKMDNSDHIRSVLYSKQCESSIIPAFLNPIAATFEYLKTKKTKII
ncbi:MAG: hypothetical protein RR063_07085 [Anaerovoracaceae bacterium]